MLDELVATPGHIGDSDLDLIAIHRALDDAGDPP